MRLTKNDNHDKIFPHLGTIEEGVEIVSFTGHVFCVKPPLKNTRVGGVLNYRFLIAK